MPPAERSTSGAKASANTSCAPQYRITIAAAAPPHSASLCGRNGTARTAGADADLPAVASAEVGAIGSGWASAGETTQAAAPIAAAQVRGFT
jgi:hypothetical protein